MSGRDDMTGSSAPPCRKHEGASDHPCGNLSDARTETPCGGTQAESPESQAQGAC